MYSTARSGADILVMPCRHAIIQKLCGHLPLCRSNMKHVGGQGYSSLSVGYPRSAWTVTGIYSSPLVCLFVCLSVCNLFEALLQPRGYVIIYFHGKGLQVSLLIPTSCMSACMVSYFLTLQACSSCCDPNNGLGLSECISGALFVNFFLL